MLIVPNLAQLVYRGDLTNQEASSSNSCLIRGVSGRGLLEVSIARFEQSDTGAQPQCPLMAPQNHLAALPSRLASFNDFYIWSVHRWIFHIARDR